MTHHNPRMHKAIDQLNIAIVTPTYGRELYLNQTWRYVQQQIAPVQSIVWLVLDDSPRPHPELSRVTDARLRYHWQADKRPVGYKRNWLNDAARALNVDIVCAMDDDDWYGVDYVHSLTELLLTHDTHFAGSSADAYFSLKDGLIYQLPAYYPDRTCNNFMAYTVDVLTTQRYSDDKTMGEEPDFLGGFKVVQHPHPERVHVSLAHPSNTVTKKNIVHPQYLSTLRLHDLPMNDHDRAFYESLVAHQS